jgi:hypothetical protein
VNLLGEPKVSEAFQRFAQTLGGTRHSAADLDRLAAELQRSDTVMPYAHGTTRNEPPAVEWPFEATSAVPQVPIDTFVGDWLRAGNIVGRGRRGLDALVIRTPIEQLQQAGLIKSRVKRRRVTRATEKTVTTGYALRLLPDKEDELLRKDVRRTRTILGRLTLNLPCFGLWMPRDYWEVFCRARVAVQERGISTESICAAATRRRQELEGAGIAREIEAILADFQRDGLTRPECLTELRSRLSEHFRTQLAQRTPDLIARAAEFRTGRQAVSSDLDLQAVARSLFVDLVQSTFSATYGTGVWPRRFRSLVGRELARRVEERCKTNGAERSDRPVLQLLDASAAWEHEGVAFERVTAQMNQLFGEAGDFPTITMEELLRDADGGYDGDD